MRLRPEEKEAITQAAREVFAPGTAVLVFGSRTDDRRRGGDVDLLVETPAPMPPAELVARRTRFVARLYRSLDEQRIDAVITARCPSGGGSAQDRYSAGAAMNMNPSDRLAVALWEAGRHACTLAEALGDWDSDPSPDWPALDADREKVRLIDQLLLRFIKLQDSLSERLLPVHCTASQDA